MAEPDDKIVVLESFDNVIMANLVKTKLDAYGIPCFITNENFTALYPIRNEIFSGAQVYIFEKDRDQAQEILAEGNQVSKREVLHCPRCGSSHVVFEESDRGYLGRLFTSVFLFMLGMPPNPRKRVYHCHDCAHEFGRLA